MPTEKKPDGRIVDPSTGQKEIEDMETGNSRYKGNTDGETAVLDERVRAQLGRRLSAYYSELVNQPIPDKFIELLNQLDKREKDE